MKSPSALGSPSEVLPSILEVLEARIAPASATFIDIDGDSAVVKTTKGTDTALQAIVNASVGGDSSTPNQMETLILSSLFAGTSLTVEVSNKAPQGDGLVNVWRLEATNMDLGSVVVKGDLASLQAGDTTYGNGSVKSVSVQSVGVNGGASMKGYDFLGGVSSISVAGDVNGAYMNFFNTDKGGKLTVGKLTIGGSLIGGANAGEGSVLLLAGDGTDPGFAEIKTVTIGGQMKAGAANKTGSILVGSTTTPAVYLGKIGSISVGGEVAGSTATEYAGTIYAATDIGKVALGSSLNGGGKYGGSIVADTGGIGSVAIAGSMFGGDGGDYCGTISAGKEIKSVTVGGGLIATGDAFSASILSYGKLGKVAIAGDVTGNGQFSARIAGPTSIESVTIGGSLIGGASDDSGVIYTSGPISKSVSLGGDLDGGAGNRTGSILAASVPKAVIGGGIHSGAGGETGLFKVGAIGDLTIGGDIDGFSANSAGIYADTLKGKLVVNGNLSGAGDASYSGYIYFSGNANSIDIKGGIYGGTASMAGIVQSGYIQVGGTLKSLTLGQITAGTAFNDTNMMLGSVRAGIIDTMVVKGNITGNSSQFVLITGQGDITKTKGSNLAIKSLTVGGTVSYANILAGYDIGGTTMNGDGGTNGGSAQIGTVKVVGGFLNSSIAAGANNFTASSGNWGSGSGTGLTKPSGSTIASSIAKIVIQGLASASVQSGIVAQDIQSLSLGGHAVSPIATGQPGPSTKFLIEVLP